MAVQEANARTYISIFPPSAQHPPQLPYQLCIRRPLLVINPALPVVPARADEDLLSIGRHRATDVLFALDIQPFWHGRALAGRHRALFQDRHGRRRERKVYP